MPITTLTFTCPGPGCMMRHLVYYERPGVPIPGGLTASNWPLCSACGADLRPRTARYGPQEEDE
jgi:hypothetical protein